MLSESTIADIDNRYTVRVLLQILRTGMLFENTIGDTEHSGPVQEYCCRY